MAALTAVVAQPIEIEIPTAQRLRQNPAYYSSLDDLSALVPEEVRLPQPTLCKVTTEAERGVELDRSNGGGRPEAVMGDNPVFEVHLRVLLNDFPSTHVDRAFREGIARGSETWHRRCNKQQRK